MKRKSNYTVAVMGATGAVGEEMIKILVNASFQLRSSSFWLRHVRQARNIGFTAGMLSWKS